MFDSADAYSGGLAEEILGKAIAGRRDRVLISTKAWLSLGDRRRRYRCSRFHLMPALDAGLRRLGTDYVDFSSCTGSIR